MKVKKLKNYFSCCKVPEKENEPEDVGITINDRSGFDEPEVIDEELYNNYVVDIDPCIDLNGKNHNTYKYEHMKRSENPNLVIRRGQAFKLILTFNQAYDKDRDTIAFVFKCRENNKQPSYSAGTLASARLTEEPGIVYSWSVAVEHASGNTLAVNLRPPPTCAVGIWDLEINTKTVQTHTFRWRRAMYILFNPWCEYDDVYMESEEWREETVLATDGVIWRGSPNSPSLWKYSQFERDILDCSIYLMTVIGRLSGTLRSDPITVSRTLSAAVNANDDRGVVVGNWSGNYDDGKSPSYWTGSREILQQYYTTRRGVRYGQCWVFAGVLTSVCRALGLPSRVITNFSSAHDTDASITIDFMVDENGKIQQQNDSIWNFHVWSEAWMKRPDIGEGCDGWQAIDATPQEQSNGMYRCGPASVSACKQGDIWRPHDLPFLFAEVNGDIAYWFYDNTTNVWKLLKRDIQAVGKNISTKAPGSYSRLDVTDTYKYPEGSKEERAVFLKAIRQVDQGFSNLYVDEIFDDIVFTFEHLDDVLIGQDFSVLLHMHNRNTNIDHEISAVLRVDIIRYTGKFLASVAKHSQTVVVNGGNRNKISLNVSYGDYHKLLEDNCVFVISCLAQVNGTNQRHFDKDDFRLKKPNVEIELQKTATVGETVLGKVKLTNPLPNSLRKSQFVVDAPGLEKQIIIDITDKIQPQQTVTRDFKFVPQEPGRHAVAAKFISKELQDVNGFRYFVVNN